MRVALFAAVATAALQHGPLRLPPRLRLGRAPPVVLTAKKRTFEFCSVDDAGEIESCELVAEDDLPLMLGLEQTARVLSDPMASELFFGKRAEADPAAADSTDSKAKLEQVFTLAEYRMCIDDDLCEVPDDIVVKAMGPDALVLKERGQPGRPDGCQPPSKKARFHLHFGAGRLGMGLVVPAISASGIPFGVVQRPKPRWVEMFTQDGTTDVGLSVNSEVVAHSVEIVESDSDGKMPSFMPPQSLVFGSESDELKPVVDRATSFSCSLGSAMSTVLLPLLSELPEVERAAQPTLFCCENDHDAVVALKTELAGKVAVIDCMVDRVCTGRSITEDGVDVSAEPWKGSIVVLEPNLTGRLPFCSSVATAPRSAQECDYLSQRKFSLVNGMHTTLAFMTLGELYVEDDGGREYVLLKYTQMPREQQRTCEAWRSARCAQLIDDFGMENIMEWHDVATREEAWEVLLSHADNVLEQRFSLTDDVVSRVLGGGVSNRWLTRLRPTDLWMEARLERKADDGISAFLEHAVRRDRERALERGCSLEDAEWRGCEIEDEILQTTDAQVLISSHLAALTERSGRFCNLEVEITHNPTKA